ncbi:MAG: hypothetical protein ACPHID_06935 [Thermoplasmatota archaeon]
MGQTDHLRDLHGARFLILLDAAGLPSKRPECSKVIYGTIKFAKLDFFLRCPEYLYAAVRIVDPDTAKTWDDCPTLPMHKYKMGPFEREYYDVFAILESKGLLEIRADKERRGRAFHLTNQGQEAVEKFLEEPRFQEYHTVAKVISNFFGQWGGNELKDFLYDNFPEVGEARLNQPIQPYRRTKNA